VEECKPLATDSNVDSKVVATAFSATLGASVDYASKGARRPLNSEASLFVPSDGTKTEFRRPLLLAPTKLAVAAVSEEAARTTVGVRGRGLYSSTFQLNLSRF